MNFFHVLWCRIYQFFVKIGIRLLRLREPQILDFADGIAQIPAFAEKQGWRRGLIVTGGKVRALGLADAMLEAFDATGVRATVYDKTTPNPTIAQVEEAYALYRKEHCDFLIALGGGSPMDCAKLVGARVARPHKSVKRMRGLLKVGHRRKYPPLIAIPTTAGSGSEATLAAVVTDGETHRKFPVNDPVLIPRYVVFDPTLTRSLPPDVTAQTGMDALTHVVEAYIGGANTLKTWDWEAKSLKLIFENLPKAYRDGDDLTARRNMQLAAYYAGLAFTRAFVGYVHALAHALGGKYDVPHGKANAILLPYVMNAYGPNAYWRLGQLGKYVGISEAYESWHDQRNKFLTRLLELRAEVGIEDVLDGVREEDIPALAKLAAKEANPLYPVPKEFNAAQLAAVLRQACGFDPVPNAAPNDMMTKKA